MSPMLYYQHLRVGFVAHSCLVALTTALYLAELAPVLAIAVAGVSLPFTLIGAVFPDMDETSSRVYQVFPTAAAFFVGLLTLVLLHLAKPAVVALTEAVFLVSAPAFVAGELALVLSAAMAAVTYTIAPVLLKRPTHREFLHQLPTGVCVTLLVYGLLVTIGVLAQHSAPLEVAGVCAGSFFVGFCSHLAADRLLFRRQTYIGQHLDDILNNI